MLGQQKRTILAHLWRKDKPILLLKIAFHVNIFFNSSYIHSLVSLRGWLSKKRWSLLIYKIQTISPTFFQTKADLSRLD